MRGEYTEAIKPHIERIFKGEYSFPTTEIPSSVLDIGANEGGFSEWAREQWPACSIVAYEPVQESASRYRYNHRGDGNILFQELAVCPNCQITELFKGLNNSGEASRFDLGRQSKEKITVTTVNPEKLPACEFIKIDTEGSEVEILSGLDLSECKWLVCEYHDVKDIQGIKDLAEKAGLTLFHQKPYSYCNGILKFTRGLLAQKKKLFIGLPIYGNPEVGFMLCCMRLMAEFPVNCVIEPYPGDSLVSRARNVLTRKFLETDCTHFLQIDSDLVFSNEHIARILSHDEDVVGGFYPKKKDGDIELVFNTLEPQPEMDGRRLTQVKYMGTGFLCVSRKVIEQMIVKYGDEITYTSDCDGKTIEHDIWPVGVYKFSNGVRRFLSEDWYFCQRALDLGFKVWGDNAIMLAHIGKAQYPLSHQQTKIFSKPETASEGAIAGEHSPSLALAP